MTHRRAVSSGTSFLSNLITSPFPAPKSATPRNDNSYLYDFIGKGKVIYGLTRDNKFVPFLFFFFFKLTLSVPGGYCAHTNSILNADLEFFRSISCFGSRYS